MYETLHGAEMVTAQDRLYIVHDEAAEAYTRSPDTRLASPLAAGAVMILSLVPGVVIKHG